MRNFILITIIIFGLWWLIPISFAYEFSEVEQHQIAEELYKNTGQTFDGTVVVDSQTGEKKLVGENYNTAAKYCSEHPDQALDAINGAVNSGHLTLSQEEEALVTIHGKLEDSLVAAVKEDNLVDKNAIIAKAAGTLTTSERKVADLTSADIKEAGTLTVQVAKIEAVLPPEVLTTSSFNVADPNQALFFNLAVDTINNNNSLKSVLDTVVREQKEENPMFAMFAGGNLGSSDMTKIGQEMQKAVFQVAGQGGEAVTGAVFGILDSFGIKAGDLREAVAGEIGRHSEEMLTHADDFAEHIQDFGTIPMPSDSGTFAA